MEGHVVEGCYGEYNTCVPYRIRQVRGIRKRSDIPIIFGTKKAFSSLSSAVCIGRIAIVGRANVV